jgi:hypothetical protein
MKDHKRLKEHEQQNKTITETNQITTYSINEFIDHLKFANDTARQLHK